MSSPPTMDDSSLPAADDSSSPESGNQEIAARENKASATLLDKIEQGSKIFATALIPVVIAIGGWIIQSTIEKDKENAATISANQQKAAEDERISLEYVKLAKEILTSEKPIPKELTKWSWQLIDKVSPSKFDEKDLKNVIEGNVKIPSPPPPPVSGAQRSIERPSNLDGFVISILRARTERRAGLPFSRTVGFYHVYFQGQELAGLEGETIEREGPGDNSPTGVNNHRRLEAGAYPLSTAEGDKYSTSNYADPGGLANRPWPAIGVGETGSRSGILIHSAQGFIMSIGTINLSKPLDGAADIDFGDSRQRVIALIKAMKEKLGSNFPVTGNTPIPNAWLVIAGEPGDTSAGQPEVEADETPN